MFLKFTHVDACRSNDLFDLYYIPIPGLDHHTLPVHILNDGHLNCYYKQYYTCLFNYMDENFSGGHA